MPVKISATASQSSNKPQPFPKPKPPYELFPTTLTMCDGRVIRVSVPVPDRLSMIIDITPEIFGPTAPKGLTVAQWVLGAGHYLNAMPHNTQPLGCQYFENKKWYRHVTLGMGHRDSSVRFEFSEQTKKAPALSIGVQSGPPIGAQKGPRWGCVGRLMLGADFVLLPA